MPPPQPQLLCIIIHIYTHTSYENSHAQTYICIQAHTYMQRSTQIKTVHVPSPCHRKCMLWIGYDLKPDTREYSKLCVYEASFPVLLKHLLNCHSHLSNCIISFIFLLLCPEYESIMSCGCPPKLSLVP